MRSLLSGLDVSIFASRGVLICHWENIQARAFGGHRETAIVEVRGACPFWGNHAGTDGRLRRAGGSENLALPWLDHSLEYLAALAGFGVGHAQARHFVT